MYVPDDIHFMQYSMFLAVLLRMLCDLLALHIILNLYLAIASFLINLCLREMSISKLLEVTQT